jgi:hypothetical protein
MYTIIWDIDDTLNNLMYWWFIWFKKHNTVCRLDKYEEIVENPPYKIMGIPKERYLISIDTYRKESFYVLKPNEDIFTWFEQFGESAEHIALTSTPLDCASISAEWLFRNFGQWFRTFHIIPSDRRMQYHYQYYKNKADLIQRLNKENIIFIDDSEHNIKDVKKLKLNIETYLVKQPWNDGMSIDKILKEITKRIERDED